MGFESKAIESKPIIAFKVRLLFIQIIAIKITTE